MRKTIRICSKCGTPLIWTFRWDYQERFCLNCGVLGGMLETGRDVELTPELEIKARVVNKIWDALYGKGCPLLSRSQSYKMVGCKKCDAGQNHNEHLTKREIRNNRVAERILKKMEGIF